MNAATGTPAEETSMTLVRIKAGTPGISPCTYLPVPPLQALVIIQFFVYADFL